MSGDLSKLTKLRHILPRRVKIKLVLLLIGIIVGAQIETLTIMAIQPFIFILTDPELVYTNQLINFVYRLLGFNDFVSFLAFLAVVIAIIYAFRGLYLYYFSKIQNKFIAINTVELSNRVLVQTLKKSYLFHINHNVTQLQRVVGKNVDRFMGVINGVMALLIDGLMALFVLVFLLISSASMTIVVLFFAAICIVVYYKIFKSSIRNSGDVEAKGMVAINKSVLQALYGIKEIKTMRKEAYFVDKYKNVSTSTVQYRERIKSLRQLPKLFIESFCFSGAFIVVAGTIIAGVDLQMLLPQLGIFVIAAFKLLPAISRIVNTITQIIRQSNSINQVYGALYEQDEEFGISADEPNVEVVSRDIIVSNVTFKYPNAKMPVLRDVSFTIPRNKSVAFVGSSGAGKLTLIDIILGILPPQQGSVVHNGMSVHHHYKKWARHIGYVPQVIYLLDETIMENVAFGVPADKIDKEKVWIALERAQLKDFVLDMPEQLQTMVGDRGVRISGGQRQRIGIARALYNDPPILVMDEATSSLDNETEKAVVDAIRRLQGSKTMIIVAHRPSTIKHCDIVYRVKGRNVKQVR